MNTETEMVAAVDGTMLSHDINADGTGLTKHCCGCWVIDRRTYIAKCNECSETRDMAFYPLCEPPKTLPLYNPDEGKTQLDYEHFLAYSGLDDTPERKYIYFHGADVGLDKPKDLK